MVQRQPSLRETAPDVPRSPALELVDVSHSYQSDSGSTHAIEHVNLHVAPGEIVSLVGPSGAGKSTIIHLIAGFLKPTSGSVTIDGDPSEHARRRVGIVQQADSLFPWMTVAENVAFSLRLRRDPDQHVREVVRASLELVGLLRFGDRWIRELSGGMRKRAELARVIAFAPRLWLLDEPFASLDIQTQENMQLLLLKLWAQLRPTIVMSGHDLEEAAFLSHRVLLLGASPACIAAEFVLPFDHPRSPRLKVTPEFVAIRSGMMDRLRDVARGDVST